MEDESLFFLLLHHMDHGSIIFTVALVRCRLQGNLEKRIEVFNRIMAAASRSGRICFWMGCDDSVDLGRKKYPLSDLLGYTGLQHCDGDHNIDIVGEEGKCIL